MSTLFIHRTHLYWAQQSAKHSARSWLSTVSKRAISIPVLMELLFQWGMWRGKLIENPMIIIHVNCVNYWEEVIRVAVWTTRLLNSSGAFPITPTLGLLRPLFYSLSSRKINSSVLAPKTCQGKHQEKECQFELTAASRIRDIGLCLFIDWLIDLNLNPQFIPPRIGGSISKYDSDGKGLSKR